MSNKFSSGLQEVAELMVQEGKSFRAAAELAGLEMTAGEAKEAEGSKTFQKLYRTERNKYAKELAKDPQRDKDTTIGLLVACAKELMVKGMYEKAAEVLFKLAKVEGHVGAESEVTIFNLSAKDIEAAKERIKAAGAGRIAPVDVA